MRPWSRLDRRELFSSALFRLRHDRVRCAATGGLHDVYVLESRPWVNVVPATTDGKILLVRQYRQGTGQYCWEVPGGMADPDEAAEDAAMRELAEETGYRAEALEPLGVLGANPAIQDNEVHVFAATGCRLAGQQKLDAMEDIQVRAIPAEELSQWVLGGRITHAISVASVLLWLARQRQ